MATNAYNEYPISRHFCVMYANPLILGGLFTNGKDRGRCLTTYA